MPVRQTPSPRERRRRPSALRVLVAAALAAPLALGTLATTALPASAVPSSASISHSQEALVGVPGTATFTCLDLPERPVLGAIWEATGQPPDTFENPTPGNGSFVFSRDFTFDTVGTPLIYLHCVYAGDDNTPAMESANVIVHVRHVTVATDTIVSFAHDRVEPGEDVEVSATVTTADGPVTESWVQFWIGDLDVGRADVGTDGVASTTITGLSPGAHTIEGAYYGTDILQASFSDKVVWVKSSTSLTTDVPAVVRAPDTVLRATASTYPGWPAPSGSVTFHHGTGTVLGTAPLVDGQAVLALPGLAAGDYTDVVAVYSGDDSYGDASSGPSTMTVEPAPVVPPVDPTVTVPTAVTTAVATPARITVGFPTAPRPTGTVTVTEGSTVLLEVPVPATGDLTLVLPVLAPGTHDLVVRTAASPTVNATEHAVRVTVSGEPAQESPTPDADLTGTTSTLTSGEKITLVARGFLPGETVAFYLHSDPVFLGTAVADADGVATLVVALPAGVPAGAHHVQATGGTSMRWAEIAVTVTDGAVVVDPPVVGPVVTVPVAVGVVDAPAAAPLAAPVTAVATAAPATAAPLAATGAEIGSTALLVSVLLGSGALLLVGRRRSGATR